MSEKSSEIKQNNFRINQETADRFRQFCEDNGFNQAQGFDHVMQVLEIEQAKDIAPSRKTEIESFEMAAKSINALYLQSLELCENAEMRAREQFARQLESKDNIIASLQVRLEAAEAAEKDARDAQNLAEQAEKVARERTETAERERSSAEQMAAAKEQVNSSLSEKLARQEESLVAHNRLLDELSEYKNMVADLNSKLHDAEMEMKMATERAAMEKEKAIMDTKEEMNETLRKADKENAFLQAKIEMLQEQIRTHEQSLPHS